MIVSCAWLQDLLVEQIPAPAETARILTSLGLEVEQIVDLSQRVEGLLIATVTRVETVERGSWLYLQAENQNYVVFCTDHTIREKESILYAPPGTSLPAGDIGTREFGDKSSQGMAVSLFEAGLGGEAGVVHRIADKSELLALSQDTLLILGITPNRGDCLSHLGVARELAASMGWSLPAPGDSKLPVSENKTPGIIDIRLENKNCPRYGLLECEGLAPAPEKLALIKRRIGICGQRSISPMVDLTNYLLLEIGQPTHAFDRDKVHSITVRGARDEETAALLDGNMYELAAGDLVIDCDGHAGALAGIMGGSLDSVSDTTDHFAIESAWFDPIAVRRTRTRLGLNTEASYRFERNTDPLIARVALERFGWLAANWFGMTISGLGWTENAAVKQTAIEYSATEASSLLGKSFSKQEIQHSLSSLGFECSVQDDRITVLVPSWRSDIEIAADLSEEMARIVGFDDIEEVLPSLALAEGENDQSLANRLVDELVAAGLFETVCYDFYAPNDDEWWGKGQAIALANPLGRDLSLMRRSLVPGLLRAASWNLSRQEESVWLFEHGRSFVLQDGKPRESERITILATGPLQQSSWHTGKPAKEGWLPLRLLAERVFRAANVDLRPKTGSLEFASKQSCEALFWQAASDGAKEPVAILHQVPAAVAKRYDLNNQLIWILDFNLDRLAEIADHRQLQMSTLPAFPGMERDLALLVPANITAGTVEGWIAEQQLPHLEDIVLFDRYDGKGLPEGFVSLGFRFHFRSADRSLTSDEVDGTLAGLFRHLQTRGDLRLREGSVL